MLYHSTRGVSEPVDAASAILSGLAPDGGLYLMDSIPRLDLSALLQQDTYDRCTAILSALLPDIGPMDALVRQAYTHKFTAPDLTPTRTVGPFDMLELYHGPTSAFKDIALCMLPQLISAARRQKGMTSDILILTATSGDTGKAALAGFQDVPGVRICVFYPHGGVSDVQRAQMVTQPGDNVRVCAVRGNFDDAQSGVKRLFSDAPLFEKRGLRLSSANSINIGRLAPQVTYYFKAYRDLLLSGRIAPGDAVNFAVPTGNFGNILAGYLAACMGLPVGRLICASNANNVLTDFIRTGCYDRRRPLLKTQSPSMDILISSNLERLLFLLSGGDSVLIRSLMEKLAQQGVYAIPDSLLQDLQTRFWAGCADDSAALTAIGRLWREYGYLCDTHTAAAWCAAEEYQKATSDRRPMVVLSTASPFKFPAAVLQAIGVPAVPGDEFAQMEQLSALTHLPIPAGLAGLRSLPERHRDVIDPSDMLHYAIQI